MGKSQHGAELSWLQFALISRERRVHDETLRRNDIYWGGLGFSTPRSPSSRQAHTDTIPPLLEGRDRGGRGGYVRLPDGNSGPTLGHGANPEKIFNVNKLKMIIYFPENI